jgi:hypothetical protein
MPMQAYPVPRSAEMDLITTGDGLVDEDLRHDNLWCWPAKKKKPSTTASTGLEVLMTTRHRGPRYLIRPRWARRRGPRHDNPWC